jgi:hypothetical protein
MPNHEDKKERKENSRLACEATSVAQVFFFPNRCVCTDQSVIRAAHQKLFDTEKDEQNSWLLKKNIYQ